MQFLTNQANMATALDRPTTSKDKAYEGSFAKSLDCVSIGFLNQADRAEAGLIGGKAVDTSKKVAAAPSEQLDFGGAAGAASLYKSVFNNSGPSESQKDTAFNNVFNHVMYEDGMMQHV